MLLEQLCFCLIIWATSQAQDLEVFQPSLAESTEGGSITMSCSYSTRSEPKVGSYRWMKDSVVEVKNHTREFLGRVTLTSDQDFLSGKRADIEIQDLRHYDSGTYRCVVDIPGLPETTGNGTVLRVIKPAAAPKEGEKPPVWLWAGLASALGASVSAFLIRLYCTRRRGHRAKVSRTERMSQDCEAKAATKLNYAELSLKKGRKSAPRKEMVTYASVDMPSKVLE